MKNRISAQTARDRKRKVFVGLQDQLAVLSQERVQMRKENELLRKRNLRLEGSVRRLESENGELRARLSSCNRTSPGSGDLALNGANGTPIESAEFISVCPQNKQGDRSQSSDVKQSNQAVAIWMVFQMIFLVSSLLRTAGRSRRATLSSGASRCSSTRRNSVSWPTTSSTNCLSVALPISCPPPAMKAATAIYLTTVCLTTTTTITYLTACLRAHLLASHKQRIHRLEMMKYLQQVPTI